jgi:hypothetical protein
MSLAGDEDDMSLRQQLVDQFGDEILEDDEQSRMDTSEHEDVGDDVIPDDSPLDFSVPRRHNVSSSSSSDSSSSSSDDEDEPTNAQTETNPLRRIIQKNVSRLLDE